MEYYWKETADYNEEMELKIINQLSNSLKEKLLLESNKLMLKECFASNEQKFEYLFYPSNQTWTAAPLTLTQPI